MRRGGGRRKASGRGRCDQGARARARRRNMVDYATSSQPPREPFRMFSHPFYNVVHIVGIIMAVAALGGAALLAIGTPAGAPARPERRLLAILHGVGTLLILV